MLDGEHPVPLATQSRLTEAAFCFAGTVLLLQILCVIFSPCARSAKFLG
jgi:hypothetical protein